MHEKKYAESFRDLIVYQKSRALSQEIFELTKGFPKEELFSLTDQVRRSSRSVGAQIAEAWAKRGYEKHFTSKLTDADGEQMETQHWIETAQDCHYITSENAALLLQKCHEVGRLLAGMIAKASLFCQPTIRSVREDAGEYFIEEPGCGN
jgi:four helix bundle protein